MDCWNEREKRLFKTVSELVSTSMLMASSIDDIQFRSLSIDSKMKYLSYELGVIEFFSQLFDKTSGSCDFSNFLIYYSSYKYGLDDFPLNFLQLERRHQKFLPVRELGFMSESNSGLADGSPTPGHSRLAYFNAAKIS
ncbi:hypothetical protein [Shewanella sp. c952]|uniref:hypothetical protein n=1 Tax=Shewanella sp. c952 TaxID=2815913 RepID=UPI001C7D7C74|nr:hypothetical protein [Shewanella sp. c952]